MLKILLFIFYIYLKIVYLQNIPNPTYNGNTLKYSISINLTKYLETLTKNSSEVENKTIYEKEEDLIDVKTGLIRGTVLQNFARMKGKLDDYIFFNDYDEAQQALNNHTIEQFICLKDFISEQIQMLSENLTYIEYDSVLLDNYENLFLFRKEDVELIQQIKTYYSNHSKFDDIYSDWIGLDEGLKHINTTINNPQKNLNVFMVFNYPVAYIENGEYKGFVLDNLFSFSNKYNYNLNILSGSGTSSIEILKNKTVNISLGFTRKEVLNDPTLTSAAVTNGKEAVSIIRYDNAIKSKEWIIPNSINDFNGYMVGVMKGHEDLVKKYFPNSEIYSHPKPNELINRLLREDFDALLIDKLISDYYENKSTRITHYDTILANTSYGFSFNKENIRDEFNDFLNNNYDENNLNTLFEEWKNADENKIINENIINSLSSNNKILDVYFYNIRPMCYEENLVYKGYELDLLYKFAQNKGYKINLIPSQEESTGDNRVIIGCQNITLDNNHYFSNPIKNSTIILLLRPDSIRHLLPFKILDENYQVKGNNIIEIPVIINGENKTSLCLFPDIYYNDTILMNCTIDNIILNDNYDGNIKYEDSKDRIQILYSSIRVDNLMKANELFNDNSIIEKSNLSKINEVEEEEVIPNSNLTNFGKKKNNHLSTGAIIGILIPCLAVVVAITIASFLLSNSSNKNIQNTNEMSSSIKRLNINNL